MNDFLEFIIVYGIFAVPLYGFFTLRRELQPIRGRVPELSLVACIFHAFSMLVVTLRNSSSKPWACWTEGLVYLGPIFIVVCLMIRALYLVFTVQITNAISQHILARDAAKYPWIWNRRWILKPNFLATFAALLSAIVFLPLLLWNISKQEDGYCAACNGSACYIPAILLFTSAFILTLTFLSIRKIKESLFIRSEIGAAVVFVLLSAALLVAGIAEENDDVHLANKYLSMILVHGLLLAYPLRKSFRVNKIGFGFGKGATPRASSQIPTSPVGTAFQKVVNSAAGFEAFKVFLIKELSVENLIGWKAVKELRGFLKNVETPLSESPSCAAKIAFVLETHIISGSPAEVNIGYNYKAEAMKLLESLPIFSKESKTPKTASRTPRLESSKEAKKSRGIPEFLIFLSKVETELIDLMRNDSFARFIRTEQYKKVWAEIVSDETRADVLGIELSKSKEDGAQPETTAAQNLQQADEVPISEIPIIF